MNPVVVGFSHQRVDDSSLQCTMHGADENSLACSWLSRRNVPVLDELRRKYVAKLTGGCFSDLLLQGRVNRVGGHLGRRTYGHGFGVCRSRNKFITSSCRDEPNRRE